MPTLHKNIFYLLKISYEYIYSFMAVLEYIKQKKRIR